LLELRPAGYGPRFLAHRPGLNTGCAFRWGAWDGKPKVCHRLQILASFGLKLDDKRNNAVTVVDLADLGALVSGVHCVEYLRISQPEACGIRRAHSDHQLGDAGLGL